MANVVYESKIDNVAGFTTQKLQKAAEIIGGMMESKAKQYITEEVYQNDSLGWYIRTGNLRNSITHAFEDEGLTIVVGSAVDYAPYVELGTGVYAEDGTGRQTPWRYQDSKGDWHITSGMPPRPYLRPTIENHIDTYKAVLEDVFKNG